MTEPIESNEYSTSPKTVLEVLRYRDGQTIQQIAAKLPNQPSLRLLKIMLNHLHKDGRIETYRERFSSPLRYRKPEPLDWPDLSALHELVEDSALDDYTGWLKHQLVAVEKKLRAMIESHAEVEAERIRNWVTVECIWRVEFNEAHGQIPRVNYVEASEGDTRQSVHSWQNTQAACGVYIVECRRADESDVDELLEMTREEEGW